jgi:hypothetical protein
VASESSPAPGGLATAAKQVRDAAQWIVASLGAVGALLIAGLSLSDLSKLEDWDLAVAIGAAVAAFAGIGWAIAKVASVLVPQAHTVQTIQAEGANGPAWKYLDGRPEIMSGLDVPTLHSRLQSDRTMYAAALTAFWNGPNGTTAKEVRKASAKAKPAALIARSATEWGNYGALRQELSDAVRGLLAGATVAVIGVGVFAYQTGSTPDVRAAALPGATLEGANLTGADLRSANLARAKLGNATLTRADLRDATLSNAALRGADLTGANLKGTSLSAAQVTGAVWNDTTCPDGTNSGSPPEAGSGGSPPTCVGHLAPDDGGDSE